MEILRRQNYLRTRALCRPKLEYADVLWDPSDNASIEDLELVQNKA
jgi:hypothetical protein